MISSKIDLVIPLYNKKNHIERCLNSAINQKKKFNKIIIVNDGSTDNVYEILNKYEKDFNFIEVLYQENQGASVARNNGAKLSKADFVVFIDADDELNHFYLLEINRLISFYENKNINIYSTKHRNIYDKKHKELRYFQSKNNLNYSKYSLLKISFDKSVLCASGMCIDRRVFEKYKFPEGIVIGEDIYFWQNILLNEGFAWSNEKLINVYKNSENRVQEIHNSFPYYLLKTKEFLKKIKNFEHKLFFYLFQISSFFIVINQQKRDEKFNLTNFKKVYDLQDTITKLFIKIFLYKIFFSFYLIAQSIKKNTERINIKAIIVYSIITPSSPLIFFIIFFKQEYVLSSMFSYYISLISAIIFIFSFQQRIYLSKSFPKYKLNNIVSYRLMISTILLVGFTCSTLFLQYYNKTLILFCLVVLLNFWVIEILVLFFEKFKINKMLNYLVFILVIYYLSFIFFKFNEKVFLIYSLVVYFLLFLFIIKKIFRLSKNSFVKLVKVIANHYGTYFFLSGIFLTFSNYFFKLIFINYYNLTELSFFLLIYTIGTLPSSFYYTVIGQYLIENNELKKLYLILCITIVTCTYLIIYFSFKNFIINSLDFLIISTFASAILMVVHFNRVKQILELDKNKFLIFKDLIFYLSISLIPLILIINTSYEKYIFLAISLIGFVIYNNNYKIRNN